MHAVAFFFLPAAASFGQSELALHMLLVLLASAVTSIGCYVISRPLVGLLLASLGVAAAVTMWGWQSWEDRPRPAERIEATFPDFKLIIPAGEACFPSFGGNGVAFVTLPPKDGECPRLGEGTRVRMAASHQPAAAIGEFSVASNLLPPISITRQQVPELKSEERLAMSDIAYGGAIVLLGGKLPSPLYSCRSGYCNGAARYRTALVAMNWWEEPHRPGDQTMMDVAQKLERWTQ
ncbi:MAG: hypothetical protein V4514_07895 [Pseudomonadota bacterium]|uniref:hypothetical protein n=1 Tax=unclassified Phenylobacterium TaxID=2640670 RepID=UPI0012E3D85F|nr:MULTISPECIES: hypothetical protein [unclassified Phenylobacterium]MBT9474094.1 hypothetical protein [Phenylobacterium sp.]